MTRLIRQFHDSNTWTYDKHMLSKKYPDLTTYDQNKILRRINDQKVDGFTREQEIMIWNLRNAKNNEPFLIKDFNIDPNHHKKVRLRKKNYSEISKNFGAVNKSIDFPENLTKNYRPFNLTDNKKTRSSK